MTSMTSNVVTDKVRESTLESRTAGLAQLAAEAALVEQAQLAEAAAHVAEAGDPAAEFEWRAGLDGARPTIAELHAHRALVRADPTAEHVGGNRPYRDHQLDSNTAWANTKCAWPHKPGQLGFSPVAWKTVRNPERPYIQLDLVILVSIQSGDLGFRDTGLNRVEIEWECHGMWVVPASVLHAVSAPDGKSTARSIVALTAIEPYAVDDARPLTAERLRDLIAENDVALPDSCEAEYGPPGGGAQ